MLGHVGPLGKNLSCLSSLGSLKFQNFLNFLFILTFPPPPPPPPPYLRPFRITLDYASIANIEELMKFYNLGDKTFETDFSFICLYGIQTNTDLLQLCWQYGRFFFLNWIPCQSKEIQMSSHKHIAL